MKKKLLFIILVVPLLLSGLGSWSCSERKESLVVAWSPYEHGILLWVAEDQEIFERNGLDVSSKKYDSGAGSLDGMLKGEADIAFGLTEFPMVRKAFEKSKARILGTVSKTQNQYMVASRNRGIEKISDLKGKRIGTTFKTMAEFYLGRFLDLNGINAQDVTLVDLKTPAEWENAVADGIVDAIVTAQPYADLAAKRLGSNAVVWPAQSGKPTFGLVVSSEEWITGHPAVVNRFLKSLIQAEQYLIRYPAEAKIIMEKWLNVDREYVDSAWQRDQFGLSLDQSPITAMEDEARWMIENNLTTEKTVPRVNDHIYEDALKAIRPEAVNIIR